MKRALVIAMVLAGTAHADRRAAEQLAREAEAGDPAKFDACGRAYAGLYRADPAAPDADEELYNAAICFDRAHSVVDAEQAFLQLVATHPSSKLAGKAIAHVAMIDGATGR